MGSARDQSILAAARAAAGGGRRFGWKAAAGLAIAACVALAGTLFVVERGAGHGGAGSGAPVAQAYQRTGDIRDAFYLARQLAKESSDGKKQEAGSQLPAFWDVNRDGVVDQADVNALAVAAVALPEQGNGGVR
jgi:hypothetical protein